MTLADAIVPLALASQLRGHGRHGPAGQLPCGERRVLTRAAYDVAMQLVWCCCGAVPLGARLCRMRGLTGVRLCRTRTPQGNSVLRVKAHTLFAPGLFRKAAHAKAPPG
ncbi:hypothetical protein GCM10010378_11590 [Streptomyces viridochromogenes]